MKTAALLALAVMVVFCGVRRVDGEGIFRMRMSVSTGQAPPRQNASV